MDQAYASTILGMFLSAGDEDYIVARWAAKKRFYNQFCWSSQQALEKLLKCVLLMHGESILFDGRHSHDITKFASKSQEKIPEFRKLKFKTPKGFPRHLINEAKFSERKFDYFSRVQSNGATSQRYRELGHDVDAGDLHKIDQCVFFLRQLAVASSLWSLKTTRRTATGQPLSDEGFHPFPKEFKVAGVYDECLTYANYAFFPKNEEILSRTLLFFAQELGSREATQVRGQRNPKLINRLKSLGVFADERKSKSP